jgi:hypothetical protein
MRAPLPLLVALLVGAVSVQAQDASPEEAVRRAIQGFFDALREKDETGLRQALAPGARIIGIRSLDGQPSLQVTDFEDFIPRVMGSAVRMDERHLDVAVETRGDLANVWQRFNMFIDGALSHCGTEVIHLYRFPEGWKILHLSETLTSQGCEAR